MQHAALWKRILNEGMNTEQLPLADLIDDIIKAQIIVDTRSCDGRKLTAPQLSPISIPFEKTFIECEIEVYGTTKVNRAGEFIDEDIAPTIGRIGGLVWTTRTEDGFSIRIDGVGCFHGMRPAYLGGSMFKTDKNGLPSSKYESLIPERYANGTALLKQAEDQVKLVRFCICDTLSMLACKNVSLAPHENDPQQTRRAIKRHGGTPESYRYHTLVVRPAGAKSGVPAQDIGIMPRHMCRGHYQHYGLAVEHGHPDGLDRGLLFGKHAGKFYMPPHLKGDKKNGVVEKDYEVPSDS